jgi:hypothetical protein
LSKIRTGAVTRYDQQVECNEERLHSAIEATSCLIAGEAFSAS